MKTVGVGTHDRIVCLANFGSGRFKPDQPPALLRRILLVGSPGYFARYGRPSHPKDLSAHTGLIYTNSRPKSVWRFQHASKGQYAVTVSAQLRVNNADIMRPALLAGAGLALQPEFLGG